MQRLSHIDPMAYLPLMEEEFQQAESTFYEPLPGNGKSGSQKSSGQHLPSSLSSLELAETSRLPLVIKVSDLRAVIVSITYNNF